MASPVDEGCDTLELPKKPMGDSSESGKVVWSGEHRLLYLRRRGEEADIVFG